MAMSTTSQSDVLSSIAEKINERKRKNAPIDKILMERIFYEDYILSSSQLFLYDRQRWQDDESGEGVLFGHEVQTTEHVIDGADSWKVLPEIDSCEECYTEKMYDQHRDEMYCPSCIENQTPLKEFISGIFP